MKDNPFISDTFTSLWSKHFCPDNPGTKFQFIEGPFFFKPTLFPIYLNVGKNMTKGISYILNDGKEIDFKQKAFLIYDVPDFFGVDTTVHNNRLKCHRIRQYPGFLIGLENVTDLNGYMTSTFSKSSRYKLNKYKKRLEACFDIHYTTYYGAISKETYDFIFEHFKRLLEKRFEDKQTTNNNLDPREWDFYREVAYPMILEKKASLFVVYDGPTPIAVTLSYFSETVLFDAITVFDIDYSKFHLGSVNIIKLIEWCLENGFRTLDFSKGYFDYKKRWATQQYNFEYHVYYDSKSWSATLCAYGIKYYFTLKQWLRERNINEKLHRFTYLLKNRKKETPLNYEFLGSEMEYQEEEWIEMDLDSAQGLILRKIGFDFVYLNNERLKDLKIYQKTDDGPLYLLVGKTNRSMVRVIT